MVKHNYCSYAFRYLLTPFCNIKKHLEKRVLDLQDLKRVIIYLHKNVDWLTMDIKLK